MEEICQRNNATIFWMIWTSIIIEVKCKKIERMLPQLSKMVRTESSHLIQNNVIMEVKKTNIEGDEFYQLRAYGVFQNVTEYLKSFKVFVYG